MTLKCNDLNLDEAYSKARALEMARLHSASYSQSLSLRDVQINTVYANDDGREQNHSANDLAVFAVTTKVCFFCGKGWHVRSACPARHSTCNGCGKVGYFSKVCRSKPKQKSRINMIGTHRHDSLLTTVLLKSTSKHGLQIAEQTIKVNGSDVLALFDTGSSENFIDIKLVKWLKMNITPCRETVSMRRKVKHQRLFAADLPTVNFQTATKMTYACSVYLTSVTTSY
ncbi:hypothetical protein GJ496_004539 [Pomphorhynchus laevis]|nr:hypothetical protein GJ496_004539 [Pomphorhynchus laevis]